MKLKKGDQVKIIAGKDKGKTGAIMKVLPEASRVVVDGINVFKKRVRPKRQGEKGEVVVVPRALHLSNVMLLCGNCKKETRAGLRFDGDNKERYCKKCEVRME